MEEHGREQPQQEAEHPVDGRLRAYLRRLVGAQGRMKAADELGVNYKTLARGLDEPGPLTVWLRAALLVKALERGEVLQAGQEQAGAGADGAGSEVPAGRMEDLAGDVRSAAEAAQALTDVVELLRQEHWEQLAEIEQRLAAVEALRSAGDATPVRDTLRIAVRPPPPVRPQAASPRVVTVEAGTVDERAYGVAWPLVKGWRAVHERHPAEGKGVDWLRDEERLRELEIALIADHELALPPERHRWDGFARRAQRRRWRERTLARVRGERRRAQWRRWLRRLLTLGIWWA